MRFWEILVFGLVIGLPGAALQMYLYKRERSRLKKSPLWAAWGELQRELAKTLHHPHPEAQELDHLLERLETFTSAGLSTISSNDRMRLTQLLRHKVDDEKQPRAERVRAEFLLFAMPRAQAEQKIKKSKTKK